MFSPTFWLVLVINEFSGVAATVMPQPYTEVACHAAGKATKLRYLCVPRVAP
jgi:hypothetical protein